MNPSTQKKSARTKTKRLQRSARPHTKTGARTGAARITTRLTKTANGEPPIETRFSKGESGNPNGRPSGASLQAAIRRLAEMPLPRNASRSYVEAVAERLWNKALRGDIRAIRIVLDRIDGKVSQPVALESVALPTSIVDAIDKIYGERDQADE